MNKKRVLIIEDDEPKRDALHEALDARGFEAFSAVNVADARHKAKRYWESLDVLVLDMRLNDYDTSFTGDDDPAITGAGIGIEFRRESTFPPEALIWSAYPEINYYRMALELGVAAYLSKVDHTARDVMQHVRVLALRHALNTENPKTAAAITRIAAQSKSRSETIRAFCQKILKPEFEACLSGVPFVILFTEENDTRNCADNAGLPEESRPLYHTLQALAHGIGNSTEPFILESNKLKAASDEETALLYQRLDGAAFLPLSLSNRLRVSIGILQEEESERVPVPVNAKALSKILSQYLRPAVLENIITIWSQLAELRATRNATARLCQSVGQEIKDSLETPKLERLEQLDRLDELANDLNDTGQLLFELENREWMDEREAISISEVATMTWDLIAKSEHKAATKFALQGDCTVQAQRMDLEIIVSRILQWFAYRISKTPPEVEPSLKIICATATEGATVTFEDNSYRLPPKLRQDMFAPFTQAIPTPFGRIEIAELEDRGADAETKGSHSHDKPGKYLPFYLAKMLIEGRYQGSLDDDSDKINEHPYGHRFVMRFPTMDKRG